MVGSIDRPSAGSGSSNTSSTIGMPNPNQPGDDLNYNFPDDSRPGNTGMGNWNPGTGPISGPGVRDLVQEVTMGTNWMNNPGAISVILQRIEGDTLGGSPFNNGFGTIGGAMIE